MRTIIPWGYNTIVSDPERRRQRCARERPVACAARPPGTAVGSMWKKRSMGFPWSSGAPVTSTRRRDRMSTTTVTGAATARSDRGHRYCDSRLLGCVVRPVPRLRARVRIRIRLTPRHHVREGGYRSRAGARSRVQYPLDSHPDGVPERNNRLLPAWRSQGGSTRPGHHRCPRNWTWMTCVDSLMRPPQVRRNDNPRKPASGKRAGS